MAGRFWDSDIWKKREIIALFKSCLNSILGLHGIIEKCQNTKDWGLLNFFTLFKLLFQKINKKQSQTTHSTIYFQLMSGLETFTIM